MSSVNLPDWIDDDEAVRQFQPGSDAKMIHKLPPWTGNDRAMLQWLGERLRAMRIAPLLEELAKEFKFTRTADGHTQFFRRDPRAWAIEWAEQGDIEPLRKLYPNLAKYIHLPKLDGPGEHYPRRLLNPITEAARDTQRIRALWKKFYGRYRRRRGDKSAEAFAAELWSSYQHPNGEPIEVTEHKVIKRLEKNFLP